MKISADDAVQMQTQEITNLEVKGLFVDDSPWFIHIIHTKDSCISYFNDIHFIISEGTTDEDTGLPVYAVDRGMIRNLMHYPYKCNAHHENIYNFDPLKPHFYIIKLGFTGVFHYFSYFCSKT